MWRQVEDEPETVVGRSWGLFRRALRDVVDDFREALLEIDDLSKFPKLDKSKVAEMDRMFATDIPQLLEKAMAARR